MAWIIIKASRNSFTPYKGISCDKAKVPKGKYYEILSEAEKDKNKLCAVNPVGFKVEWIDDFPFMN